MTELRRNILMLLPTAPEDAVRKIFIANQLWESISTISNEIKTMRNTWVPLCWNNNWIYFSYDKDALINMKETIYNMREWYYVWMTNIHNTFNWIINWEYEEIRNQIGR